MLDELGIEIEVWSTDEMIRPRTRAREEALRALFMCDFLNDWSEARFRFYFSHFDVEPEVIPYGCLLCQGVLTDLSLIESQISRASEHWTISRMCRLDRCLLRMAVFELNRIKDISRNVVMNEAIELAKLYGNENSAVFVNGVLDRVAKIIDEDNGKLGLAVSQSGPNNERFIESVDVAAKLVA